MTKPEPPQSLDYAAIQARAEHVLSDYEDARRHVAPYEPPNVDMRRVALARDVIAFTETRWRERLYMTGAAYELLRKFHKETDCGKDGPDDHWHECDMLVAEFGWESWDEWVKEMDQRVVNLRAQMADEGFPQVFIGAVDRYLTKKPLTAKDRRIFEDMETWLAERAKE